MTNIAVRRSPAGEPDHGREHLVALDGLRGFAALIVVLSHCANKGFLPEVFAFGFGQMGVTLFFGLSGFLMAYLYANEPFGRAMLWQYAVNRAARVLPLYYAVVIFTGACFAVLGVSVLSVDSYAAIAKNLFLIKGSDLLWTIPVEIHFYAVFVALWAAASRGGGGRLVALLAAIQVALLCGLFIAGFEFKTGLLVWLHVFLFGAFLGMNYDPIDRKLRAPRSARLLAAVGWLALLLAIIAPPGMRREFGIAVGPAYLDPISVGYPLLVLSLTVFLVGPFSLFRSALLRWYGKISYSLYLLHMFAVVFVVALVERGFVPVFLAFPLVLALATGISFASYTWLERPAQRILRRFMTAFGKTGAPV